MQFVAREEDIALLQDIWQIVKTNHVGQMVTVTGRPQVGKTSVILQAFEGIKTESPVFYFYVDRHSTERTLIATWLTHVTAAFQVACPPTLATVGEFFQYLLTLAQTKPAVVVFDACTAFDDINPNLWSQMQKAWDLTKNQSALMVVMCDASVSAMKAVFYEKTQSLFGRPSYALTVKSFTPQVMTSLVLKANPEAKPIDLLTLYAMTGGVPGLLEDFVDHGALTAEKALQHVCSPQGAWVRRQGEVFSIMRLE